MRCIVQTEPHAQTHACRPHVCHADPACLASLLGSHEQRVWTERSSSSRRRDLQRGRVPGESAAGDEESSGAGFWEVHALTCLEGASAGLCVCEGVGGVSVSKLGWCESMMGHWKPQTWSRGNKGIPPHTMPKRGVSRNHKTVNINIWLGHAFLYPLS